MLCPVVVCPVCPGITTVGKITGAHPVQPDQEVPGEMVMLPVLLLPDEGGPQDGVSGEMGAKPASLSPEGGPQDGVSGEMGAKPASLSPEGGPQDGVSGEIGAKPASLLPE